MGASGKWTTTHLEDETGAIEMLTWDKLLCDWRVPSPGKRAGPSTPDEFRTPFEADYDRIVYSRPFRRLARKTQVHPLAPNDHVHNRLTHSVEVASVGRSFARRLARFLKSKDVIDDAADSDLGWIMMSACAVHDIGNPPFGHAGEYAIREWAQSHQEIVFPSDIIYDEATKNDVLLFEGNAQGFRVAARSDNEPTGHLRLTYATLGAMVKYPWDSSDSLAKERKKYNCFTTEKEIFASMFDQMGLARGGRFLRHPLSFLSEAADDICYRVLDLEDAAEMGIIPVDRVREIYGAFLDSTDERQWPLSMVRGMVISEMIRESWRVFEADYDAIMHGGRDVDLKADFNPRLQEGLMRVREAYGEIFSEVAKVATELGAYKALGRIVKALCNAVAALKREAPDGGMMFVTRRTLALAWEGDYIERHRSEHYDWWLHQVLDFVSSLTDNAARQLTRDIEGI